MDQAEPTVSTPLDMPTASGESRRECPIAEILQFSCEIQPKGHGSQQFHCFPIPRLFMLCQAQPAIEITGVVNIDPATAEVNVPKDIVQRLPKAKQWKDITRSSS